MRKTKTIAVAAAIGIFAMSIFVHRGQSSQSSSSQGTLKRRALLRSGKVTTINALTTALSTARVPGGIATVTQCREDIEYTFSSSGPTLEDALRAIESTDRQYAWNVSNGLVNIFPAAGDPALLRVRIRKVHIVNAPSIDEAANQLFSSHEVQQRIIELHLTPGFTRLGMSDLKRVGTTVESGERHYSLGLANVTLRRALNAISRAHGKAVWEYRERRCSGRAEFQIQFLVR